MLLSSGRNSIERDDEKVAINISECNEKFLDYFYSNIENLFNINKRFLNEEINSKIFSGDIIKVEDISEIIVQLSLMSIGFEYLVYSYNAESTSEKAKNFDGIFLKDNDIYYLEVKTKLETNKEEFCKDINNKIHEANNNIYATKIKDKENYAKLESYCNTHFEIKKSHLNKPFDALMELVEKDTDLEKFNLMCCGAVNTDESLLLKTSDITDYEPQNKEKTKSLTLIGLNMSIAEEFNEKLKEKYGI